MTQWASVVEQARAIVEEYPGGCTLRQAYYRMVVIGAIDHKAAAYRKLSAVLAQARRRGDFAPLIDNVREIHVPPSYADPAEALAEAAEQYRRDRRDRQQYAVWLG